MRQKNLLTNNFFRLCNWRIMILLTIMLITATGISAETIALRWSTSNAEEKKIMRIEGTHGVSYTIDWGDNITEPAVGFSQNGIGTEKDHIYAKPGTYTVIITGSPLFYFYSFDCSSRKVQLLDISGCSKMRELDCYNNQITSLNVNGATNLQVLDCESNQLTTLDIGTLGRLSSLTCNNNQLSTLNISSGSDFIYLSCSSNEFKTLNLSGFSGLTTLNCNYNLLETLNVSGCTGLTSLRCFYNQLKTLDVSGLTKLRSLSCTFNELTTLNVSGCTDLIYLQCFNNLLATLNVSGDTNLQELYCNDNQLTTLDLSNHANLQDLHCQNNLLATLNISGCTGLQYLWCYANRLPLSELYNVYSNSNGVAQAHKLLGDQTIPAQTAYVGDDLFASQSAFNSIYTTYPTVMKDGNPAQNTDYSVTDGKIKFLTSGSYTVTMTNTAIVSNTSYRPMVTVGVMVSDYLPTAPQNLTATPSDSQVTLNWVSPASNGASPITKYQYSASTGADNWQDIPGSNATTVSYTVNGLINGTSYIFKIRAVNGGGNGAEASTTATPRTVPTAPQNLVATPDNGQATLNWAAPSSNGGSAITKYQYSASTGADNWQDISGSGASTTSHTVTGLTNGTSYTLKVRAVNAAGNGAEASTTATPRTVPTAPQNLVATPDNGQATLNWTAPASNGGSAITKYQYSASTGADNWQDIPSSDASTTSYTITGLTNGTSYTFKVRAINIAGNGAGAVATATPHSYYATVAPASYVFPTETYGYDNTALAKQFTITNTGTGTITGLDVALRADSDFEMSAALSTSTMASGSTATFTVQPKAKLAANASPHADVVTIHWNKDGGDGLKVNLSFTVNPKTVTVTANGGQSTYGQSPANPGISAEGLVYNESVYALTGLSNDFYIKATTNPGSYSLKVIGDLTNGNYAITKRYEGIWRVYQAAGAAVGGAPTISGTPTIVEIVVNPVTIPVNPGNQAVEYAISTFLYTGEGMQNTLEWQSGTTFVGPFAEGVIYYVYARSAANEYCAAGTAQVSDAIIVQAPTGMDSVQPAKTLIVWVQNDRLYVSGLAQGALWSVYNITGTLVYQSIAESDKSEISLPAHGVYIVRSGNNAVNVIF